MNIRERTIRDTVQEILDERFEEVDLLDYIYATNLSVEDKEWAAEHLGVHVTVDIIEE